MKGNWKTKEGATYEEAVMASFIGFAVATIASLIIVLATEPSREHDERSRNAPYYITIGNGITACEHGAMEYRIEGDWVHWTDVSGNKRQTAASHVIDIGRR